MMTFAFMSFSTPGLSLEATLALAQQCGYDGIEPRMDAGHAHGIELATTAAERAGIRRRAEAAGIQLACLATSLTGATGGHARRDVGTVGAVRRPGHSRAARLWRSASGRYGP